MFLHVLQDTAARDSDGFDLPFYNGYAVDVAALLAVYALVTYFVTLWPTWVCCVKIRSWRSYRKWLVIVMLLVELLHVVCAFLMLDRYRGRETTFGNKTPPDWTLQWTFFTTVLALFSVQGTIVYVANAVCHPMRLVSYILFAMICAPFAWSFYITFVQGGHPDLASYAAYISQTATLSSIGDAAIVTMLSCYVLRPNRRVLYSEAFVHVAEFLQPMLCLFTLLRAVPWILSTMFELPSFEFPASAMKLAGLEVVGNLYPVLLIVAVNAYEDASPTEIEEHWKDFRLTIIVPVPLSAPEMATV